jgi:hypothetical protein
MKTTKILSLCLASLALGLTATFAATPNCDLSGIPAGASGDCVEVNLSSHLLSMASRATANTEPDAADLLKGIRQLKVNIISLDDSNREAATTRIQEIREGLGKDGWERMVSIRSDKAENVDIHVRSQGADSVEGLVVTIVDKGKQAVVLFIDGTVKPEQVAKIAARFHIQGIPQLDCPKQS